MDFVIVGGGIYGAAVAWELASRGAGVLVLEAAEIGSGASGGVGRRGVRANGRDLRELPLMRLAYERWPSLHEEIASPTGYERCGHLMLVERPEDLDAVEVRRSVQEAHGIPSNWLEAGQVRELEPEVSTDILGALWCPLDGVADHTATTRGMADAAVRRGAVVRTGCRVTGLEVAGGRVRAVRSDGDERIPVAGSLLLLANTGVPDLLRTETGLELPVWSWNPQVLLTEPLDPVPVGRLVGHAHRRLSLKPVIRAGVGHLMISGGWRGERRSGRPVPRVDQIAGNLADARAVYPALAEVAVVETHAERVESSALDDIPILDRVPGAENAFFATGWSGHGWAIAPAVARLLSDWVLTAIRPELLDPFGLERFGRLAP
jgi:sarcosine oxidase subunit beta